MAAQIAKVAQSVPFKWTTWPVRSAIKIKSVIITERKKVPPEPTKLPPTLYYIPPWPEA